MEICFEPHDAVMVVDCYGSEYDVVVPEFFLRRAVNGNNTTVNERLRKFDHLHKESA